MSANIKASIDGTQAIIGVGGVDQMTVSNAGVVTANSFVGAISAGNISSSTAIATGSNTARTLANRFADVINVKDFGASGDGSTDDSPKIQLAINYAILNNKGIYFPSGTYLIKSVYSNRWAIYADCTTNKTFSITLENDSIIKAGSELNSLLTFSDSKAVIRIENSQFSPSNESESVSEASQKICVTGGEIDLSLLTPNETAGIDGLSIGASSRKVEISSILFNHGITPPNNAAIGYGGGDSGLFVKEPLSLNVTNCRFVGSPDVGIYISGDSSTNTDVPYRRGKQSMINGCTFYRCTNGIAQKRFFEQSIISSNHFYECQNGIIFANTDGATQNTSDRTIVSGNYIRKMQGNPIALEYSKNININGNTILDYRKWISNGTTDTQVSNYNYGGAVKVDTFSENVLITGNILGFDEWTAYGPINATNLTTNQFYRIIFIGTTDFTLIGASSNTIGTVFQKNSTTATGDGTAGPVTTNYGIAIRDNSSNIHVAGNLIQNAYKPIISEANCSSVIFVANRSSGHLESGANNNEGEMYSNRNYVNFYPSDSTIGNPATIRVDGLDSTDLVLQGAGTGVVKFGEYTNTAPTVTGYITIKSIDGEVLRVAVQKIP